MCEIKFAQFDTPLGSMIATADETALYRLEFAGHTHIESEFTPPMRSIEKELRQYFDGKLRVFKTPLFLCGTPFQKQVWEQLQKIPYGETISYEALAVAVGNPQGCRAVAQANGANPCAVIIPCHRVINKNGNLGGYASGISRKQWLLHHEQ